MKRLEAVLFDLDGTLLDSANDIAQGLNKMLIEDGRQPLSLDVVKSFLGDGSMELCRRALLKTGGVAADDLYPYVQKFIAHYRAVRPDPAQIYPGGREFLEKLSKAGVKMGVCTNKSDGSTRGLLKALDLDRYFGFVAGGDTFEVHKPNPGHVTGVLEALEVGKEGAVFIGDGPRDVAACKAAGIPCILITHGYGGDFEGLKADAVVENFDAVKAAVEKLNLIWG